MNRNKRKAEQKKGTVVDVRFRCCNDVRALGSRRRISCQDLGNGDCEGWMWHQKERTGLVPKSWRKYWFKLKDRNLYCYKDPRAVVAQMMFHVPAFLVTVTADASKTFSFKISNSSFGTAFFRTKDCVDLSKWVTKLQLSTLPEKGLVTKNLNRSGDLIDVSESENEDETEENNKTFPCGAECVEEKLQFCFPSAEAGSIDLPSMDRDLSSEIDSSSTESVQTCIAKFEPATSTTRTTATESTTAPETAGTLTILKASRDSIFPPSMPPICTERMSGTGPDFASDINLTPSPPPNISETLLHEKLPPRPSTLPKNWNSSRLGSLMKKPATLPKKGPPRDLQPTKLHPSTPLSTESTASERTLIESSVTDFSLVLSVIRQKQHRSASSSDTAVTFPKESVPTSVRRKCGQPTSKTPSPRKDLRPNPSFAAHNLDSSNHVTPVQALRLPPPAVFTTVNSECDEKRQPFPKEEPLCCKKFETLNTTDHRRDLRERLNGLQHSLKIKVQELQTINELLGLPIIKPEAMNQFCKEHEDIVYQLSGENARLTDIL